MSKEVKALEEMYAELNDSSKWNKSFSFIKKALTPPTEEQICKALKKHFNTYESYNEVIRYEDGVFYLTNEELVYLYIDGLKISRTLPTHLIEMIGRFYENKLISELKRTDL